MLLKNITTLSAVLFSFTLFGQTEALQEGDIIFQSNVSPQCKAIELATHSKFSHCGLLFKENGQWMVLEAVQPVSVTTYQDWIARSKQHFAVRRLKNADTVLTPEVIKSMKQKGKEYLGRNYDSYFGWSGESIYCSELVWKIYNATTTLKIGTPKPMKEYDLSHPLVKSTMKERYGNDIPLNKPIISPGDIYTSPLLETVFEQ